MSNDISKQLETFLNSIVPRKYPESNHILVHSKNLGEGNMSYNIHVNPTFAGSDKIEEDDKFADEFLYYVLDTAMFGITMFKESGNHYISSVNYFWD
jgi:hypothetical protein